MLLLGNHEGMVLAGDVRYTRRKYLETARQLGMENYRQLFSPDTELGRWLATRNTMLRIGRNLFVHAGLSARLLERNLEMDTLNARMSEGLYRTSKERREDPTLEFLYRSAGPVWYRGMVCTDEKYDPLTPEQTDALLRRYDADRLLVGHTIFPDISTFHDGRVIAVNVQNELNRRKNRGRAVLIDCGANAECTPEYLLQFAYMGSYYARTMLGIATPRVGLLSNGTEDHKGSELQHETFPLLKAADAAGRIRFVGNVEASQVFSGDVDVVVTDGFTGNVLLKGIEGSIKYMTRQLKGIFMKNFKTKMAALAIKDEFHALKASLDPNEVGGTAMLGISKPVIKAHGSSDARAIYNAIRQAISFVDSGIIDDITANISYMRVDKHAAKESN